ncbi:MAG: gamma-glutamyl-gamma-aminobutyrate hydrolase family protein [Pygmaiobacter sp.]
MKKRPIIGITCNISYDDKQPMTEGIGVAQQSWQLLATDYIFAIKRAGGIPVILPLLDDEETIKELLQSMDGILMSGGTDIDPKYSNELKLILSATNAIFL